jgi:hypothetical protein
MNVFSLISLVALLLAVCSSNAALITRDMDLRDLSDSAVGLRIIPKIDMYLSQLTEKIQYSFNAKNTAQGPLALVESFQTGMTNIKYRVYGHLMMHYMYAELKFYLDQVRKAAKGAISSANLGSEYFLSRSLEEVQNTMNVAIGFLNQHPAWVGKAPEDNVMKKALRQVGHVANRGRKAVGNAALGGLMIGGFLPGAVPGNCNYGYHHGRYGCW